MCFPVWMKLLSVVLSHLPEMTAVLVSFFSLIKRHQNTTELSKWLKELSEVIREAKSLKELISKGDKE